MASLPPQRPASQRRASPTTASSSPAREAQPERSNSVSAASVDSQTILLNSPPSTSTKSSKAPQVEASAQLPQPEDAEPRKCWICFNDETEDDEFSSEWRSPCPCVLVAHERCLLDWIADMEAPNARRRAGGNAGKILCPQCKSEIRLQRPRSVVVDTVRAIEKSAQMMLLPGFIFVASTAVYTTLYISGVHTIYQIFGQEDAFRILLSGRRVAGRAAGSILQNRSAGDIWRMGLGIPMIPTVLVASRTTVADSFLPFLPLIFFAGSGSAHRESLQLSWPPSAAFTIATLPYVRSLYNAYYDRVWLPRELRWLQEVQPRAGTQDAMNEVIDPEEVPQDVLDALGVDADGLEEEEEENVVEIEVDFDIFADWNNGGAVDNNNAEENPPVPIARGPAPPIDAPPQDDNAGLPPLVDAEGRAVEGEAAPAPNVPPRPAQPRRQRIRRHRRPFSTTNLADTFLGALIFPSIAALVGQALREVLPKAWITPPTSGKPTGFLQTRWGRSILGGCLFVGMKDAVLLYVRWKMAQSHRNRKVLDYDKSKAKTQRGRT